MPDRPGLPAESPASEPHAAPAPSSPEPHPGPATSPAPATPSSEPHPGPSTGPASTSSSPEPHAGPTISPGPSSEPMEISDLPFALTEPADGETDEGEKAPRSRTKTIVLGSLLAVTLAGAGAIGYAGWRIASQKDATLVAPPQIGALKLDTTEEGRSTADYLQTALSAEVDLDEAVGGVYSDGTPNDVLFFGGTTLIWTPESDLDTSLGILDDEQGDVTGIHNVDPGALGGTMKCGTTKTDGTDMPVCGWADHGSLALAMFPGRTEPDAAKLLVTIRDAAQTRN